MTSPLLALRELNRATLARQMLLERAKLPVTTAVERLASLQAQHPDWPRIGLWSRLANHGPDDLAAAITHRKVVRASLMRITLHIVSAADYWPLSTVTLTARQNQFRLIFKEQPTDPGVMKRLRPAHEAAMAALADGPRSMADLRTVMSEAAPKDAARAHDYLWRHFAATVPLVDVPPPDGPARYGRSWYATADEWLGPPAADATDRRKSMTLLVERYLAAFGPASRDDIVSWTGRLTVAELKPALAALDDRLVGFRDENARELIDLADAPRPAADTPAAARFLTRWDSVLLGHQPKFRQRVLPAEYHAVVNRPNGDVLPTFLLDGFVAGTWNHRPAKGRSPGALELTPLRRLTRTDKRALESEAAGLAGFLDLGRDAGVQFIQS